MNKREAERRNHMSRALGGMGIGLEDQEDLRRISMTHRRSGFTF